MKLNFVSLLKSFASVISESNRNSLKGILEQPMHRGESRQVQIGAQAVSEMDLRGTTDQPGTLVSYGIPFH